MDPRGELEDYRGGGRKAPAARRHEEGDGDGGDDGLDSLERKYGTDAADAIR